MMAYLAKVDFHHKTSVKVMKRHVKNPGVDLPWLYVFVKFPFHPLISCRHCVVFRPKSLPPLAMNHLAMFRWIVLLITSLLITSLLMVPAALPAQGVLQLDSSRTANPWNHLHFHNDPDHFQFAVVSDRTGGHRVGVFGDAVKKLNWLQPEFVMSVGDLIEGYLENTEVLNRQWDEFDSLLAPLEMPFFYLPGNHDISNPVMRELWEQRYGRRYYHFVYKDVLFICMDTNDGEGVMFGQDQVDYVKRALAENADVRWTLLFMHHPIWVYAPFNGFDQIEEVLSARPYTVFAGHTHRYLYRERKGRNYYVLATTGGGSSLRGPKFSQFDHITWITMMEDGPRILNLKLDGMLAHDLVDTVTYQQAQALVNATDFAHVAYSADGAPSTDAPFTVQLALVNESLRPIQFASKFYHHHQLDPNPRSLQAELAAGSQQTISIEIYPKETPFRSEAGPLELDWSMGFEQGHLAPPFTLEGTYVISTTSETPAIRFTDMPIFLEKHEVELATAFDEAAIHYTLDGSEPSASSPVYEGPILLDATTTLRCRLVHTNGQLSAVWSKTYEQVKPMSAVRVRRTKQGVRYRYYEGNFLTLPDFASLTPKKEGIAQAFDVEGLAERQDHYAFQFEGYLEVPEDAIYTFYTYSDDGSQLFIGGQLVVDNDGSHAARLREGRVALQKGVHPFRLDYFEDFEGEVLRMGYEAEALERREVKGEALRHR